MKNSNTLKSVFFFVLTFTLGFSVYYGFVESVQFERDPAAIAGKIHQLKNLDPDQLKEELQQKMQVVTLANGQKFIRFPQLTSNVCKQYGKVLLKFKAEGISVAGEAPQMVIEADCLPAQDPTEMASIEVPVQQITSQKPTNATFKFEGSNSEFTFTSSADSWPTLWVLQSISFKGAQGATKMVSFDLTQPRVLEF